MAVTEWPPLLHIFTAVRMLYVPKAFSGHIALALEDVTWKTVVEVLPALELLYVEDQSMSSIEQFVAVRRDSGRPVTVVNSETEFDIRLQST